jgi:hypothetical protein
MLITNLAPPDFVAHAFMRGVYKAHAFRKTNQYPALSRIILTIEILLPPFKTEFIRLGTNSLKLALCLCIRN